AAERIGPAFAASEAIEDIDTLGGLLVTMAGRVPVRGEIIGGPGEFEIEVLDADPRRVKRLRIGRRPKEMSKREARKRPNEEGAPVAPNLPNKGQDAPAAAAPSTDDQKS